RVPGDEPRRHRRGLRDRRGRREVAAPPCPRAAETHAGSVAFGQAGRRDRIRRRKGYETMTREEPDGERETERDEELQRLLSRWSAAPLPDGMDARMLAAYRRQTGAGEPWWRRIVGASVRVPLPVAVAVLLLLIVTAALARRPAPAAPTAG